MPVLRRAARAASGSVTWREADYLMIGLTLLVALSLVWRACSPRPVLLTPMIGPDGKSDNLFVTVTITNVVDMKTPHVAFSWWDVSNEL